MYRKDRTVLLVNTSHACFILKEMFSISSGSLICSLLTHHCQLLCYVGSPNQSSLPLYLCLCHSLFKLAPCGLTMCACSVSTCAFGLRKVVIWYLLLFILPFIHHYVSTLCCISCHVWALLCYDFCKNVNKNIFQKKKRKDRIAQNAHIHFLY